MNTNKFAIPNANLSGLFTGQVIRNRFELCIFQVMISALLLTVFTGMACALELPTPETLEQQYGLHRQAISIAEPHLSTKDRPVFVRYTGLPMNDLLTQWFGDSWSSPDNEIVFFARDGYHSAISTSKLKTYSAYLTFGRDDGAAFVIDNSEENQKHIFLDPYYLVWDNRSAPDLLRQGSYGWPYQITRIELHRITDDKFLLPPNATKDEAQGFGEAKEYCLTCHRIKDFGGEKYPEDLVQASCRWTDIELKAWIDNPYQVRTGTAMPPLNRMLPANERRGVIERIVLYLNAMKKVDPNTCADGSK